jgi:hypothetical protein
LFIVNVIEATDHFALVRELNRPEHHCFPEGPGALSPKIAADKIGAKATSGPNESSRSRNGRIGHSRRQLLANAAFRRQGSNKRSEITVKFQLYTCSQFYSDRRANDSNRLQFQALARHRAGKQRVSTRAVITGNRQPHSHIRLDSHVKKLLRFERGVDPCS